MRQEVMGVERRDIEDARVASGDLCGGEKKLDH